MLKEEQVLSLSFFHPTLDNAMTGSQKPLLSEKWLQTSLGEATWRYRLLGRLLQFSVTIFQLMSPIGMNYALRVSQPIDEAEWTTFLEISSVNLILHSSEKASYFQMK